MFFHVFRFEICYESWSTPTSALHGSCSPSQCELNIYGKPDVVKVGDVNGGILTDRGLICDTLKIENGRSKINVINDIPTCVPKIENGIINLQVRESDPGCHVEVVNAKIKYPEIATTPPPTADKSDDPTSTSSFEWWKILLIVFVGIVVFGIFAFFGYLCYKKQRSTKSTASPTEEPKPVISVAQESTVTIQPPSKTKRPDLNFTKFEPSKSRKTQNKTAKKEPTTTEEYVPPPAPKVTVASPPDPTKPVPRLPQYSIPQRLVPRIN
uniref:Uncharacterized protein n=1 Tax=Panagrolaimus superbus TaxID=310955 RepID=A0A914Z8Q3_9BILA